MENRGGPRERAGRKPKFDLSDLERQKIVDDVNAEAKRNNTSFGTELGKLICGAGNDKRLKVSAMQLYVRDILPRASGGEPDRKHPCPAVYLPEQRPELEPIDHEVNRH